jgi:putative transposase
MRVQRPWRGRGKGPELKKRHKPEQVVRKLREADALLSSGATIADVCIRLEVSEATYHRWRKQYSGMEVRTLKRLRR